MKEVKQVIRANGDTIELDPDSTYILTTVYTISIGLLLFGFCCFAIGVLVGQHLESPLPSIQAIQLRVGADPDGRLGPETQEKWDMAYNNQCAAETWPEADK